MSDDTKVLSATSRVLQDIQKTLRELRSIADVDRRNSRSLYDNLTFEVARQIGSLDARIELMAEHIDERFDRIEQLLTKK